MDESWHNSDAEQEAAPPQATSPYRLQARREKRLCLLLFGVALLCCLPTIIHPVIPPHDVSDRYAPMVRALAAGDWEHAFLPRTQPLLTLLAGGLAFIQVEPILALKITASLLFAAGVFPVFFVVRRVFDDWITAGWAAGLYAICSRMVRYAGEGLRESGKTTALLVSVYGLMRFREDRTWTAAVYVAVGAAGMALVRGEALLFAMLALAVLFGTELVSRENAQWRISFPSKALIAALIFVTLVSPWAYYQYKKVGYPVTDYRQAAVIYRTMRKLGVELPRPRIEDLDVSMSKMRRSEQDQEP